MYADSCYLALSLCFEIRSKAFTVENKWQFKVFQKKLPEKILVRDGKNLISTPFSTLREKFFWLCLLEWITCSTWVCKLALAVFSKNNSVEHDKLWMRMYATVCIICCHNVFWWKENSMVNGIANNEEENIVCFFLNIFLVMVTLVCKLKVS